MMNICRGITLAARGDRVGKVTTIANDCHDIGIALGSAGVAYIGPKAPAGLESNWLPAPDGKFILMFRLYWPKETPPSIIDGSWKPPAVTKVQ